MLLAIVGAIAAISLAIAVYYHLEPQLPSVENLKEVRYQIPLRIYSADNKLIAEYGEKRRIPITYTDLPRQMVEAFISAEDDRFFEHPGVDYQGLLRAGVQLVLTGKRSQGGSTITMQVARNFYLTSKKTFTRKINEILLALKIENELSKEEILELYLNKIYLGNRAYGVAAAAQIYYGKTLAELTLAETAMIAGLPKAPSKYNPIANPARAIQRRNYVLGRMQTLGYIDKAAFELHSKAPVTADIHITQLELEAPYVAEMARKEMTDRFGQDAYTDGYHVFTTIDSQLQNTANNALRRNLRAYDKRHGWRGAEKHFDIQNDDNTQLDQLLADTGSTGDLIPAIVTHSDKEGATLYLGENTTTTLPMEKLRWAKAHISEDKRGSEPQSADELLKPGDLVRLYRDTNEQGEEEWELGQTPNVSGALISLAPQDGSILALVGGYDYYGSKFNRVTQARRQPGSGFKAFIYSAALEAGYTAASLINDAPVVFDDPSLEGSWRPENYSGKFFGPTRLRYALKKSRNLVSIRLLRSMGVQAALKHATHFGFSADQLPHNLSLALGSGAVTPLEMARGYAVLANGGFLIDPYFITRIETSDGAIVEQATPKTVCDEACQQARPATEDSNEPPRDAPRVISAENRFLMYSMMQDVINSGTAVRAKALGRKDLAGKTGTTNDQRDAWFNGYNQSIVTNVWVGFDDNSKLGRGEVGGKAALPGWIEYMRTALQEIPDVPPEMPLSMVTVRIDPETGRRAPAGMKNAIFEVFRAENVPGEESQDVPADGGDQQSVPTATPTQPEDLF